MTPPVLILCAHGTRDPEGQRVLKAVADEVREALEVDVRLAFVDVQEPTIDDVVGGIPVSEEAVSAVIVPYLLSGGYHVHVDIARSVENRPDVIATPALGPDRRLVSILMDRIAAAQVHPTATLVLAPAGSSDPRSKSDTDRVLDDLRLTWDGPVRVGYASGIEPTVRQAVEDARAFGEDDEDGDVAVVSYLLSPGLFQRSLTRAGADHVTEPLGPDSRIIDIISERYSDASGA